MNRFFLFLFFMPVFGQWNHFTEIDPITDESISVLSLDSGTGETLLLRCTGKKLEVYISWGVYLDNRSVDVTYRIDKEQPVTEKWSISSKRTSTFTSPLFASRIDTAEKIAVRVLPYGENPVTAVFVIKGFEEERRNLGACEPSLNPGRPDLVPVDFSNLNAPIFQKKGQLGQMLGWQSVLFTAFIGGRQFSFGSSFNQPTLEQTLSWLKASRLPDAGFRVGKDGDWIRYGGLPSGISIFKMKVQDGLVSLVMVSTHSERNPKLQSSFDNRLKSEWERADRIVKFEGDYFVVPYLENEKSTDWRQILVTENRGKTKGFNSLPSMRAKYAATGDYGYSKAVDELRKKAAKKGAVLLLLTAREDGKKSVKVEGVPYLPGG